MQLKAVEAHLDTAEWVVWTDCDSLFTNFSRGFESVIPDDPNIHLIVSEDALMVNTGAYRPRCFPVANSLCNAHATMPGVFLLRNHAWSRELLRHWWGSDDTPHVGDTLWEQAALQAMFARARRVRHATQGTCQQELHDILEQDDGVCVCVCAVSCVDGSCRSNRLLAEALKATDTLDLLSHTLIVPQGWINPYPRELAMAMRYVA